MSEKKRKSSSLKLYPKLSIATVKTSTPIREGFQPDNFDISETNTLNTTTTTLIESHTTYENSTIITSPDNLSLSDQSEEGVRKTRVANVGKDWNHFRPQDASSIYRLVLQETDCLKDLAQRWVTDLWEKHPKNAIAFMLQFYMDVAGYQNYSIVKIYNSDQFNERNLLKEFEHSWPHDLVDYTYLLRTNSNWSNNCKAKIYEFVQEIVTYSGEKQTYKYAMLKELFNFLRIMSCSKSRSIFHTGVVLAAKCIIPLSKLHAASMEKLQKYASTKDATTIDVDNVTSLVENRTILIKLLDLLFSIILKNYACQDKQLKDMRDECMKSLYQALIWNPDFFFKSNVLAIFTKLLFDTNNEVRLTAIKILQKLMKNKRYYSYLKIKAGDIIRQVFVHRLDVNYTIAIASIDFLTESLLLYRKEISQTILNKIFMMIYNKHYPLASAAGRFLYNFISQTSEDEIEVIKSVIRFSKMPQVEYMLPLLVESLMVCAPELHSYKIMLRLLLTSEEEMEFEDKGKLLQILCHSVIQTATGKAIILRNDHREGDIDVYKVDIMVSIVVPRIVNLFDMFSEDVDSTKSLLEMLISVSDQNLMVQYRTNSWSKEDIIQFENILLKLKSLLKCFNVPIAWALDDVENLFSRVTKFNETILSYNLLCGLAHEKWSLQNSLQEIRSADGDVLLKLEFLRRRCDDFLDVCYKYLKTDNSNILMETTSDIFQAYECICELSISIAGEMYKRGKPYADVLKNEKISEGQKLLLLQFLDKLVFNNLDSIALKHFNKFCKAIMERGLPFELLPYVLTHYSSFYSKYGDIFDMMLTDISKIDLNVMGMLVSSTLFIQFTNVMTTGTDEVAMKPNDLLIGNTWWKQEEEDKYTFVAEERNAKSIIDYITYTQNFQQEIEEVKVEIEAELATQHRLITAEIKNIQVEVEEKTNYRKIRIYKLKQEEMKEKYQIETNLEFQKLKQGKSVNLEDKWMMFKEITYNKAASICGIRKYNENVKRSNWWNSEVRQAIKEKKEKWKRSMESKSEQDRKEYIAQRNIAKRMKILEPSEKTERRQKKSPRAIKNKNNEVKTTTQEILETWCEYYENKFKDKEKTIQEDDMREQEQIKETTSREMEEITMQEMEEAIMKIKTEKACGTDNIDPEMIKYLGKDGKLELEHQLEEEQAAYRVHRQTNDNIHIIRNIMERKIETGKEFYLTFLDLKAAFDTVNRNIIWKCLNQLSVNKKLCAVQTIIGYNKLEPRKIDSLLYADDIVLIADTHNKMEKLVEIWSEEIEKLELEINSKKCITMIINKRGKDSNETIQIGGKQLERVSTYEYLGSIITEDGRMDMDINNRIKKTNKIYYALNKTIIGKKEIDKNIKLKVYNAIAIPTMTYQCESWPLQKKQEGKIIATEMKFLRKISGKTKWDKIRNEQIRHKVNQEVITAKIEKKQLQWYGHMVRMEEETLVKKVVEAGNMDRRRKGRPRKGWRDGEHVKVISRTE
ncbi:reverse transcriptase (rna-dependent dna polymerase) [Holotrichia oblita]|uniref:Reverse transcriptase (Rna-dependent dna polymerase) n=1 Tax=Holotrichia oblita TaxID=644536 RepID=A0ACB9T2Z1_HOLOL|nr:reverse transcriptase (rna-dependent dna polymerase) [Holotrichia oblita]